MITIKIIEVGNCVNDKKIPVPEDEFLIYITDLEYKENLITKEERDGIVELIKKM